MSTDQYQRTVNSLDKEIADLAKKKAAADQKASSESKKASDIKITKSMSEATVKSKMRQIESHTNASIKASSESAVLAKKIAEKQTKRNDAYQKLQREQLKEQKKEQVAQQKAMDSMRQQYEDQIMELQRLIPVPNQSEQAMDSSEEYDVFVSHAWEDKESFVDEFVQELRARDIKVWYDTSQMKWGDSMRKRIDEGLSHSKFGVAILSPDYIAEGKYWTKAELNGLFQLESVNGKMLLPIWHNLTKKQVIEFSPIIADKLAMTTATMTPGEIADELVKLLPEKAETKNQD